MRFAIRPRADRSQPPHFSVIPKSTTLNHLRENLQVFDFELSDDDMQMLESVKEEQRLLILDFAKHHKEYPFSDQEPQNDE